MTGIQFVTDDKGRKTAVLIDLKKHRALWEDFWDGLISESRRKEKSTPYEDYRTHRLKRGRTRGSLFAAYQALCPERIGRPRRRAVGANSSVDRGARRRSRHYAHRGLRFSVAQSKRYQFIRL